MQSSLIPPNLTVALATTRELRDFYSSKVIEYSQLLEQSKSQLVHAEALLAGLEQLQQSPVANEPSIIHAPIETHGKNGSNGNGSDNHQLTIGLNGAKLEQTLASIAAVPSIATVPNWEAELLPQNQDSDLPIAIASLLQEHDGTILKLDFIVRTLYGKLTAPQSEVISQRILQVLEQGVSEGRWHKDPYPHANNTDCYTWSLESLDDEFINNEEPELEGIENVEDTAIPDETPTNSEIPTNSDNLKNEDGGDAVNEKNNIVKKEDILNLINAGILTVDKMKRLAKEQKMLGYNSIKNPKSFAAYFVKKALSDHTLLEFVNRNNK